MKKPNKNAIEQIALERIYRLFELAEAEFPKHNERSKRYIELARKIGTRNRARFPAELKTKFCKQCNAFLVKGKNAEISKHGSLVTVKCLECGFERKTGVKK